MASGGESNSKALFPIVYDFLKEYCQDVAESFKRKLKTVCFDLSKCVILTVNEENSYFCNTKTKARVWKLSTCISADPVQRLLIPTLPVFTSIVRFTSN